MIEFLTTTAYFAVAAYMWTVIYSGIYRFHSKEFPSLDWDVADRVFASFFSVVLALVWPIVLVGIVIYKVLATPKFGNLFERLEK